MDPAYILTPYSFGRLIKYIQEVFFMAQIVKRRSKSGALSYLIRVSDGYTLDGRQRRKSMTWNVPVGMSEKKADKEAQKQAITFEEQVTNGLRNDGGIRLKDFAEKWMTEYVEKQLKIKTAHGYRTLFPRIFDALGHIRLRDLRTGHLNTFYANLQEDGVNAHTGRTLAASVCWHTIGAYHPCCPKQ